MLNFRQARKAFAEIREIIGQPKNDPIPWDTALGLESLVVELDSRLSRIEQTQQAILQELQQRR